ncbi:MAG: SRPBCC family protein [Aeromicrobium sp.]
MTREFEVSGSRVIAVNPEVVYDAVSDVRQMGRWSPENRGAVVDGGFDHAYVGMRFVGDNKRGAVRWQTECVVVAADPGRRFAFDVKRYGFGRFMVPVRIATWAYEFDPVDGGTRVTETWSDGRISWPEFATRIFDPIATRKPSFAEFQKGNIRRTLANLKTELEAIASAT